MGTRLCSPRFQAPAHLLLRTLGTVAIISSVSGEETEAGEIDSWAAGWTRSLWPVAESVGVSSGERGLTLPWSPYRMILPQCVISVLWIVRSSSLMTAAGEENPSLRAG